MIKPVLNALNILFIVLVNISVIYSLFAAPALMVEIPTLNKILIMVGLLIIDTLAAYIAITVKTRNLYQFTILLVLEIFLVVILYYFHSLPLIRIVNAM